MKIPVAPPEIVPIHLKRAITLIMSSIITVCDKLFLPKVSTFVLESSILYQILLFAVF